MFLIQKKRGDHYVRINIDIPTRLSRKRKSFGKN